MGWNIAAYIEKKVKSEDGKDCWELVTDNPVGDSLKYILEDYNEYPGIRHEFLSEGMKKKFPLDKNGECYYGFYTTTIEQLERNVESIIGKSFTKINMVVQALGCERMFGDDGEDVVPSDCESDKNDNLTFPVNKKLIEDLQFCLTDIRNAGQREALDILLNQYMDYGSEYRVVLVYS